MTRTLVVLLALAVPLALAGCKKDNDNDNDNDTLTDPEEDTTVSDVVTETPDDVTEETVEDMTTDSEEDVTTDVETDMTTDAETDVTTDAETDVTPDAESDAESDAMDVVDEEVTALDCDTDLGDWTPSLDEAGVDVGYNWWAIDAAISSDFTTEPVSLIEVESYGDYAGPTTTGTTTLTSFEPYDSCGLCITVYEDCTETSGCARLYMADQATLELTTMDMSVGGTIAGTMTGLYLVEYDESTDSLVTDGVSMCVDVWTFSQTFADWS